MNNSNIINHLQTQCIELLVYPNMVVILGLVHSTIGPVQSMGVMRKHPLCGHLVYIIASYNWIV